MITFHSGVNDYRSVNYYKLPILNHMKLIEIAIKSYHIILTPLNSKKNTIHEHPSQVQGYDCGTTGTGIAHGRGQLLNLTQQRLHFPRLDLVGKMWPRNHCYSPAKYWGVQWFSQNRPKQFWDSCKIIGIIIQLSLPSLGLAPNLEMRISPAHGVPAKCASLTVNHHNVGDITNHIANRYIDRIG